ncbi:putative SAM-dependent methyltransferase [Desulfobaculum xiamenense]|uniref:Putative SAM-dependent methyltransferase n=1 Tax=Desulfobaculum xiamenense TaxID=995050 RepID=A0A846QNU3_9BACT|nr:methyltransferase domain-containing protein [Desulfobaculum xiamenense]NJB67075.1 putative SAM-dependent methyltransferase [Desulfobaculum xiamenense]
MRESELLKVNLCCGPVLLDGWVNVDVNPGADVTLDLERALLPFADGSVGVLACISAINYFDRQRAQEIINDVHRVLAPGGIARFATQDLNVLARHYLERDTTFWFQAGANGEQRFPGETFGEKLNEFFYGFFSGAKHCKQVYDYESLRLLFERAGFTCIEQRDYRDSRIPEVDRIDNRPEQMFFLEAVKGGGTSACAGKGESARHFADRGAARMASGEAEQGWQDILHALDIDITDRAAALTALNIIRRDGRPEDALCLIHEFLAEAPDDRVFQRMRASFEEVAESEGPGAQALGNARRRLDALNERENRILSHRQHLDACMNWLRRAYGATADDGVSAAYFMDRKEWDVSYPETTGYIIPNFLAYARITGDRTWFDMAVDMGDWEAAIQSPTGGAGEPIGVFHRRPRVFNTGQVMLGWMALHAATGEARFLECAVRAGDFVVRNLERDGRWINYTYAGPKTYKSRVAWALLELHELTGDDAPLRAAVRSVEWIVSRFRPGGWLEDCSLHDPHMPLTHLIGYALGGLLEIVLKEPRGIEAGVVLPHLLAAADRLAGIVLRGRGERTGSRFGVSATFDPQWRPGVPWSCVTGNAQLAWFLYKMSVVTGNSGFRAAADSLLDDVKRLHLVDGVDDAQLRGGLPGADPVGAPYCPYSIPNWGVKFFADSLLQRLLPEAQLKYLG